VRKAILALALGLAAGPAGPAGAVPFSVTNLADSGPGSLRQAILDANAMAGADVVTFQAGLTGTITLTSGEIRITDDLDVVGPGANILAISGNKSSRIFLVDDHTVRVLDVTISGLTMTEGEESELGWVYGGAVFVNGEDLTLLSTVISESFAFPFGATTKGLGGGVASLGGNLRIELSILRDNGVSWGSLSGRPSEGANLFVQGGSLMLVDSTLSGGLGDVGSGVFLEGGTHVIHRTTIAGNIALFGAGAGIMVIGPAELDVVESTISGNDGGGLYLDPTAVVRVVNSTISGNVNAVQAAGAVVAGGTLDLRLTTVSGNSATEGNLSVYTGGTLNLDHAIVANGTTQDLFRERGTINAVFSLVEAPGSAINGTNVHNLFGMDPILGPLADNGGPTQTHALLPGSPALDAGNPLIPNPPLTDQRGPEFARIQNGRVDLGSFESQQAAVAVEVPALSLLGRMLLLALLTGAGLWTIAGRASLGRS
jgi:hypothetical protein